MYNRRVSKTDARVEAYGSVDELNATLGLARANANDPFVTENILSTQAHLVILMGELATLSEDLKRYREEGYSVVTSEMTASLEAAVQKIEAEKVSFKGWATPGANMSAATLDVARTTCRRAERRVQQLRDAGNLGNNEILIYLNRLSDLLWLLARWAETRQI
ncbi:MAG: pduo nterm: atp:cob(i)alamin adenosyltransferase [Verrucomicrobiales bacterium]|nr:pduo nterm: atp:cob(i)alamin adenosyltransferase [Verrucomicrobiales bacterium]